MKVTLAGSRDDGMFRPAPENIFAEFQSPSAPRVGEYVHVGARQYRVVEVEHVVSDDTPKFVYEIICTVESCGGSEL